MKCNPGSIVEYFADNTVRDVVDVQSTGLSPVPKFGPSRYAPILPRIRKLLDLDIPRLHVCSLDYANEINWIVYADNAEPRSGKLRFKDILVKNVNSQK